MAHSGNAPEQGRNAILEAAYKVIAADIAMQKLREIADRTYVDGTVTEMIVTAVPHGPMEDTEQTRALLATIWNL